MDKFYALLLLIYTWQLKIIELFAQINPSIYVIIFQCFYIIILYNNLCIMYIKVS